MRFVSAQLASVVVASALSLSSVVARAQDPAAPPTPAEPAVPADVVSPSAAPVAHMAEPAPTPMMMPGPAGASVPTATTDHDTVVRRFGVDIRNLGTFRRSAGQDRTCPKEGCTVDMMSLGLRRWTSGHYAWSLGLALSLGGGGSRRPDNGVATWDTHFGVGPTLGARFLLANWQHLAVSVGPQLDTAFFLPSGSGSKVLVLDLRGELEGEVHLGMMGLPALSVGLVTGLGVKYYYTWRPKMPPQDAPTARAWSLSTLGPTALWDLVTKAYLRYYF